MDVFDRLACQVRLADAGGGLHGCGFVCGPRHVLTCAHVIEDCLGNMQLGARIGARFNVETDFHATLIVVAAYPAKPVPGASAEAQRRRDICLLELAPESAFPKDARPARPSVVALDSGIAFTAIGLEAWDTGAGITVDNANLKGETGNLSDPARLFLDATQSDNAVRPGCSGTAVFASDGVIGMIVEAQGENTGLMIPLQILREVWNVAVATPATANALTPATAPEPLNRRVYSAFNDFDREQQVAQFSRIFAARWRTARRGFVCAIAGVEDDLPPHCRDRIRARLMPLFEAEGYSAQKILVNELSWPDESRCNVQRGFDDLSGTLAVHLDVFDQTPIALADGLNAMRAPCVFYSQVDQRVWGSRHLDLLRRWAGLIDAMSATRLTRPFVHFMLFRLDQSRIDPAAAAPERKLEAFYRDLENDVNKGAAVPMLDCTDRLAEFRRNFVEEWLEKIGARLDLDASALDRARRSIWDSLPAQESFRLERVEKWIRQLA